MKIKNHLNHFLLVFALFYTIVTNAQTANTTWKTQINNRFNGIDKTKIPHHLLIDYAMEFTELSAFNGSLTPDNLVHKGTYTSIYNTLLMARVQSSIAGLVNPTTFKNNWDNVRNKNTIVLSGLYYKYSKIKANAYPNHLTVFNNKYYDKYVNGGWQNPYEDREVFAISAPILKYKRLNLQVKLPASLWHTNQTNTVQSIAVDFGDTNGYQTIAFGQTKSVSYAQEGLYEWKYKLTLTNGQVLHSHSKISIEGEVAPVNNPQGARTINEPCTVDAFGIDTVEFVGTQSYLGQTNTATIQIDYRAGSNCTITKPLIVAEGFESGLLGIENGLGDNNIQDFLDESTTFTGNLAGEITDYDIIYINWDNGKDYLQRNALLLEDIISWVNSVKTGSTQNVVLGQSMGGVLARYALADMEQNGVTHDTGLYISHDAPHQGANIPLSILYFARHMVDQFISTPLGDMNVNPGDGSPVSIEDIQTLINAPATQQLLMRNVNSSFDVTTSLHDSWQADLQGKGYPQLTRNISLSNGSHCANTQNYNPSDTLFSLSGSGKTSLLGDFLLELLGPLTNVGYIGLAYLFNEPGLLVGILPGKSKFEMNFNAKALPNVGQNIQIYKGNITFIKKLFWVADINVNLTDRSYNNPPNSLSYDYYPGGQYRLPFNFQNSSVSGWFGSYGINAYMVNGFNFIPVPSALDVGSNAVNLNNFDYLKTYTSVNPPIGTRNIPFDNFMTSHQPNQGLNEQHISFNFRNGNWLALELDNINNNQDLFDCTLVCNQINGVSRFCTGTRNYSVPLGGDSYQWTISGNAATIISSTTANIISISKNGTNSGWISLNVVITSVKCGDISLNKQIYIGTPKVESVTEVHKKLTGLSDPISGFGSCDDIALKLNISPSNQEITEVEWEKVTTNYQWSHNNGEYVIISPNCDGEITFKVRIKNNCGWSDWENINYQVTACASDCASNNNSGIDSPNFNIYPVPTDTTLYVKIKSVTTGMLFSGDSFNIKLYNNFGFLVKDVNAISTPTSIDVSSLPAGIYTILINYNGVIESHQIIIN